MVANTLAGELTTMLKAAGMAATPGNPPPKTQIILYHPTVNPENGFFNGFEEVSVIVAD